MSSVACTALAFFHIISWTARFPWKKKLLNKNMSFNFIYKFVLNISHFRNNWSTNDRSEMYIGFHVKVKWSHYRPGVAQRVGRSIAVLFHDRGTRRGWVVSSTPRPHFTPAKDSVPILQEAGWAPGPFWTGGNSRPHRDSIPDRPARSQWFSCKVLVIHVKF